MSLQASKLEVQVLTLDNLAEDTGSHFLCGHLCCGKERFWVELD